MKEAWLRGIAEEDATEDDSEGLLDGVGEVNAVEGPTAEEGREGPERMDAMSAELPPEETLLCLSSIGGTRWVRDALRSFIGGGERA